MIGASLEDNIALWTLSTKEIKDVAGYNSLLYYLYFARTPVNGRITFDNADTSFYAASYEFKAQDLAGMEKDLVEKLCSLYGKVEYEYGSITSSGYHIYMWYGINDTMVALKAEADSLPLNEDKIYITYGWLTGDELLETANETIKENQKDDEAQNYSNGNTNGL